MIKYTYVLLITLLIISCSQTEQQAPKPSFDHLALSQNILDYRISPKDSLDKSGLMFSDQGAWFAYSLPKTENIILGFSGPFLMTQQNGIWSSNLLSRLNLYEGNHNDRLLNSDTDVVVRRSEASHLSQYLKNEKVEIKQELVFLSGHTVLQRTTIHNSSEKSIRFNAIFQGSVYDIGIQLTQENNSIKLVSEKSPAVGYIQTQNDVGNVYISEDKHFYAIQINPIKLQPGESTEVIISQSFIFPEYSWEEEQQRINTIAFDSLLQHRKTEKEAQLAQLITNQKEAFSEKKYSEVLAKAHLTLQNNWRIPAGEITYEGLFPSYHYEWFNGFWSWDSWKHAVGLSYYNTDLAKKQIKLMFEFQNEDGFIADCVYRDTTIEAHNYRDTKPPLSAWAVAKVYEKDKDINFVKYMYPKLKKYHQWWYDKRDHDQDGMCEYGSTDGSLIAAKWESGMDNAIRFDNSKIVKNSEGAYSIDQESVDLNAYLYAEKLYLATLAETLELHQESFSYKHAAERLQLKIQIQFYDENDGWFYDTTLDGKTFIKGEGSEGWTPLWAQVATQEQAQAVKNRMMDTEKFFTTVPFQTMSADHPKFAPLKGYWRGPNWLDQAYFGIKGLRNYGFKKEADKATIQIIKGAEGILGKGKAIRENYHPITGEGLHAQNFSWSAAHLIMLLQKE
ncbi:lipoprotein [Dokdonia pacifica]|uniref:Putative isomerase n=1 Tax=Dokdonia pacifica TaxID=1627892 RepID=A0A238YTK3_9FLAO|nr:trehalase family glycosidase [Dokdonia pacifica]GGG10087.1 lipoprotein [Dokdonia pacifica]SNR74467.1 putative isomerase [Dokdonia pacifica]